MTKKEDFPIIPISYFTPQLMKNKQYGPGWKPKETDFYKEMFAIRDGEYYDEVDKVRKETDHEKKQEIKGKSLKALSISATIVKHRSIANSTHSGLLNIDIDPKGNPDIDDWPMVRDTIGELPNVVASFLSVSGRGVTFVVKIDPSKHKDTFFSIKDELYDNLLIEIDQGTHDISRLRYVSFDKDAIIKTDFDSISLTLPTEKYLKSKRERKRARTPVVNHEVKDSVELFDAGVEKAEYKFGAFADGHKHYFLVTLAGYCNTYGMDEQHCKDMVINRYSNDTNIDNDELVKPVSFVYSTYKSQHDTADQKETSNRLNDKITGALVTDFVRKGITPKESDLGHIAERYEANIERVREVKDRVIDEYSDEKNQDFAHTPQQAKNKDIAFWIIDDDDKITIDKRMFREFLTSNGVYRYRVTLDRWILICIKENIVTEINKADLKKIVTDYLDSVRRYDVYQYIANNVTKTFSDDWLELIPEADIKFKHDDKESVNVFYKNGFLSITASEMVFKSYSELDGYIWDTQILQRNLTYKKDRGRSDFETFVFNIAGGAISTTIEQKETANKRFLSIGTAIGYLMHDYKNLAYSPAIVFNDEVISDNPEGGTGKGILIKGIKAFKNTVSFDGKTFGFDKSFVYQRVDLDTKIMAFEDVNKNFDFERLFSVLTDGIEVEKKNKGTFYIPFSESPKIIITTNYALRGSGDSNDRRRFEIELARHYRLDYTPLHEFKKLLFEEWTAEEWNDFDLFMSECAQIYLKDGLVKQELVNLPLKRLINNTSQEFIEFIEEYIQVNDPEIMEYYKKPDLFTEFLNENDTFRKWLTNRTFCKWCREYFDFYDIKFKDDAILGAKIFRFL